ncbi:hypothetical protein KSF_036790 [Reticulibacter mediterranei]|uniref:Uncharacterized protein n=1 Tax=Reticulibacter mediterranei TaxID=2778369 RepID=A0A8J3INK4_9CHLR|nr:hypothetical protein KSF_036790 [Reticulibacter mediterranei]
MGEYNKIRLLQSVIEGRLAGMPEEDVQRALTGTPLIDGFRMQTVQRFYKYGFTATCSEAGITERLEASEEVKQFWHAQAEALRNSLGGADVLPSPVTVAEDDPQSYRSYAELTARVAECEYVAAQCETELAARRQRSWSEIGRLLCEEEIARLRWEICKSRYESTVRVEETKGE